MSITGKIKFDEGPLRNIANAASAEINYWIYSDDPANDDRGDAWDWINNNAPSELFGLRIDGVEITQLIREEINSEEQEAIWEGRALYVNRSRRKPKPLELDEEKDPVEDKQATQTSVRSGPSIRGVGGSGLNMTYSKQFLEELSGGASNEYQWENDPQLNRLLNLKADGDGESAAMFTVEGIPINLGSIEFTVTTVRHHDSIALGSYLVTAANLAGKNVTNDREYAGFPIRSLKLISYDASQRGNFTGSSSTNFEPWDITFTFAYAPQVEEDDISRPEGIPNGPFGPKRGHDYLDVLYVDDYYTSAAGIEFMIPKAVRMSLHRIYDEVDIATVLKI